MTAMLADILPPGRTLSFVCSVNGVAYARHWALRREVQKPGLAHLIFAAETDLSLVGLGAPLSRVRGDLVCSTDLRPRRYRLTSETGVIEALFDDGVLLGFADGTRKRLDEADIEAVIGENIAQLAVLLRLRNDDLGDSWRAKLFSITAATGFFYTVSALPAGPDGQRCFRSSFNEELTLDDEGWLTRIAVPMEGTLSTRADLSAPDWLDTKILGSRKPLAYQPPADRRFSIEDVVIPGPSVPIGATLTIPAEPGSHPALLFLSGTGTHDRHGIAGFIDIGSHEIVDTLSDHGWLGARFDTRGAGNTRLGDDFIGAGLTESINDARAVVDYLQHHPRARADGVVLIGHSQGGLIALDLAAGSDQVRAVVLLATPGRAVDAVLEDQIRDKALSLGLGPDQIEAQLSEFRAFVAAVERAEEWDAASVPERFWSARHSRRWMIEHLARDPRRLIARLRCPVLICQGAADIQVLVEADAKSLHTAAIDAGIRCSLKVFDRLDHLFKATEGKSSVSEYYRSRPVSPDLLASLVTFLEPLRQNCIREVGQ
jgi:pimeloyl-ACP methyl ester carboxylesterase